MTKILKYLLMALTAPVMSLAQLASMLAVSGFVVSAIAARGVLTGGIAALLLAIPYTMLCVVQGRLWVTRERERDTERLLDAERAGRVLGHLDVFTGRVR